MNNYRTTSFRNIPATNSWNMKHFFHQMDNGVDSFYNFVFELFSHPEYFVEISIVSCFILLLSRLFCTKSTIRFWYSFYTSFYRIAMIILRLNFAFCVYQSLVHSVMGIDEINKFLLQLAFYEHSNIIAVRLSKRQITLKRFVYILCSIGLIWESMYFLNWLPLILLFVNYICDAFKDILYVLGADYSDVKYIYVIIKPFFMTIVMSKYIISPITATELIIPFVVVAISLYDSLHRLFSFF